MSPATMNPPDWTKLEIPLSEVDAPHLLSCWAWLVEVPVEPIALTRFGNWFVSCADGAVRRLSILEGSFDLACASVGEFHTRKGEDQQLLDWFHDGMVYSAFRTGLVPAKGEGLGYRIPPILGGSLDRENVTVVSMASWQMFMAQLHDQLRFVPDGSDIQELVIHDDGKLEILFEPPDALAHDSVDACSTGYAGGRDLARPSRAPRGSSPVRQASVPEEGDPAPVVTLSAVPSCTRSRPLGTSSPWRARAATCIPGFEDRRLPARLQERLQSFHATEMSPMNTAKKICQSDDAGVVHVDVSVGRPGRRVEVLVVWQDAAEVDAADSVERDDPTMASFVGVIEGVDLARPPQPSAQTT